MLELKEKLGTEEPVPISSAAGHVRATSPRATRSSSSATRCVEAEQALAPVDPDLPAEERVRLALRQAA